MLPATTAMAAASLPSFGIFKVAVEKSRTSMGTSNATATVDRTRGVMEIAANIAIVTKMEIAANIEIMTKMQIAANMATATRMEIVETTTGRAVRIPRAARTSAPTAILSRPVARKKMVAGDKRRSATTTSATETLPTITGSSNVPDKFVSGYYF
jgi:hypothetical protein